MEREKIRKEKWMESLEKIYEDGDAARQTADKMEERFHKYENVPAKPQWVSEKDAILITYGDTLKRQGEPGLATLHGFMNQHVGDAISAIHILPMFPYTSDDGFSVVDYKKIDKPLGNWQTIGALAKDYDLMFDAVVNHISKSSSWFQSFLKGEEPYRDYFITCDRDQDYSSVTRPRALPLLTEFDTVDGKKYVWTTFSEDQIDLNFKCPEVLIEVLDVLLSYSANGARYIRLDAIGFLWKELGTTCMHLPKTHEIIRLARMVLEDYTPGTLIITETNVPHKDNISYFGNGSDEAHMVYQFPLPPLTMFSVLKGNARHLTEWAKGLPGQKPHTTYFNFLSSHDGIGVRPVEGILSREEQQFLVDAALKNGGEVSYKDNGDGSKSPYELNINYQDALSSNEESDEVRIKKFLAAQTILLSLQGVPGIYIHSLLGSRNDYYGKAVSGIPRRINREKLDVDPLEAALTEDTNRRKIFQGMLLRLKHRREHGAFSPEADQKVLELDDRVFSLERFHPGTRETILVLINVSSEKVSLKEKAAGLELLSGKRTEGAISLLPYETKWIVCD